VGPTSTFELGGHSFPCVPEYFGFTTEGLTKDIGHRIDYLIGLQILSRLPFFLDWQKQEIVFYPEGYEFGGGTVVPLKRGLMGLLLTFPFRLNGKPVEAILDTGAPISYMPRAGGTADGTADDFYPGFGKWTTNLYRNHIEFGDRSFDMKFGVIPDGCLLKTVTPWLCGGAFLKSGPIGFDLSRNRLHLFSNN
jgi:hypothetical protein